MKEELVIGRLAAAARGDAPPQLDVSGRVMSALSARPARRDPLPFVCAGALVVAIAVVVFAYQVWNARQDPMGEFMNSMMAVMQ